MMSISPESDCAGAFCRTAAKSKQKKTAAVLRRRNMSARL
jgi:hypothetical protein